MCFPPAVSHPVILIISHCSPIIFPMLIVTSPSLSLCLLSLPVSCSATTRSIALASPSCSSPWFLIHLDPFPVTLLAFPNSDRASLEHIQEPYLHPNLQATLQLWSAIRLFSKFISSTCFDLSSLNTLPMAANLQQPIVHPPVFAEDGRCLVIEFTTGWLLGTICHWDGREYTLLLGFGHYPLNYEVLSIFVLDRTLMEGNRSPKIPSMG